MKGCISTFDIDLLPLAGARYKRSRTESISQDLLDHFPVIQA
jgi:hypothetical protein